MGFSTSSQARPRSKTPECHPGLFCHLHGMAAITFFPILFFLSLTVIGHCLQPLSPFRRVCPFCALLSFSTAFCGIGALPAGPRVRLLGPPRAIETLRRECPRVRAVLVTFRFPFSRAFLFLRSLVSPPMISLLLSFVFLTQRLRQDCPFVPHT